MILARPHYGTKNTRTKHTCCLFIFCTILPKQTTPVKEEEQNVLAVYNVSGIVTFVTVKKTVQMVQMRTERFVKVCQLLLIVPVTNTRSNSLI